MNLSQEAGELSSELLYINFNQDVTYVHTYIVLYYLNATYVRLCVQFVYKGVYH